MKSAGFQNMSFRVMIKYRSFFRKTQLQKEIPLSQDKQVLCDRNSNVFNPKSLKSAALDILFDQHNKDPEEIFFAYLCQ